MNTVSPKIAGAYARTGMVIPPARFRRWMLLAFITFGVAGGGFAQTTGTVRGTVTDPTGGVMQGVHIAALHAETFVRRETTTNDEGDYILPALAVGSYTLTVDAPGFKKHVQPNVPVTLGHVTVVNPRLELGPVTQVVTAMDKAPVIETSSTQLGVVVGDRAVVNLPLNTRDTYQLLQLQPGVQSQTGIDTLYGADRAGVVSVNGGRGRSNNFSVNGGEANDQFVNLPAIQPSPDTIEEFRVITNAFDAEFGRNSGAVVNVVTKSGSNSLRGNLYEFFRNRHLNARHFFDTETPDFKQNQFGGTLGGPVRKDRMFFFASYEGRRLRQGISSDTVTVPTADERTGDFSAGSVFAGTLTDDYMASVLNARPGCAAAIAAAGGAPLAAGTAYADIFPGNVIPRSCFDPTAVDLVNQFVPLPNLPNATYQSVPVSRLRGDQVTFRIDQKINDHHQLNFYSYFDDAATFKPFSRFQAGGANLPGFGSLMDERIQQYNLTHTWMVSPTTINEFRLTYFREGQGAFNHPQSTNLVQNSCKSVPANQCFTDPANPAAGITPGLGAGREGVPFILVSGGFVIGNNFEGELPQVGNTFHGADSLSKIVGKHSLKFGADVRRQRFDQTLFFDINGYYTFSDAATNSVGFDNPFPSYLLGIPDSYTQGSAQTENVRSSALYLFAQDSWKIRPSVTLNYGLRWELNTPMADLGRRMQTFRPGQDTAIFPCQLSASNPLVEIFSATNCGPGSLSESVFPRGLVVPGDRGITNALTQTYYHAFAPRLGLAWSPGWKDGFLSALTGGPGKTSVRMGWGLFYNPIEQLVLEQFGAQPPFGGSYSSPEPPLFNTPFVAQSGATSPNPFNGILNPARYRGLDWSRFRPILLYGQFQSNLRTQYAAQYNFTIQRQFRDDWLLQIGYVGSQGHRLLAAHDLNYSQPQTCMDLNAVLGEDTCSPFGEDIAYNIPAGAIPDGFTFHLPYGAVPAVTGPNANPITLVGLRRYSSPFCEPTTGAGCPPDGLPVFSSIFAMDTIANSSYNSLQAMVEKRFSKGLMFQASYTWSKSFDNASSFEGLLNPLCYSCSRSLSLFDARHRLVFNYDWELPVPKYRGLSGKLLNGWALSGIVTFQSGFPVRITSQDDIELMNSFDFEMPGQPNLVGKFRKLDPRGPGNKAFDTSAFVDPPLGTIGNSPRTVCCGPGINNFDIGLMKNTSLGERTKLQFRAEFYNVVNHAQFVSPDGLTTDGEEFGRVKRTRGPREIQFALKLIF